MNSRMLNRLILLLTVFVMVLSAVAVFAQEDSGESQEDQVAQVEAAQEPAPNSAWLTILMFIVGLGAVAGVSLLTLIRRGFVNLRLPEESNSTT